MGSGIDRGMASEEIPEVERGEARCRREVAALEAELKEAREWIAAYKEGQDVTTRLLKKIAAGESPGPVDEGAERARRREAALEVWLRYEREALLANTAHMRLTLPQEVPPSRYPSVTMPREVLVSLRASYALLRNVVAELLDLDPEQMTQGEVFFAMVARAQAEAAGGDEG